MGLFPVREKMGIIISHAILKVGINQRLLNRRLFVDDVANGVGLLSLTEQRFDAIVMNPPFGQFTSRSLDLAKSAYEGASNDIFACFVARAIELSARDGLIGVLSSRLGFFLEGLESWRHDLLREDSGLSVILDLGYGVLDDALVETAAYVVAPQAKTQALVAIRVLRDRDKAARTLHLVHSLSAINESPRDVFFRRRAELAATPGKVVAYWLPPPLLRLLSEHRDLGADGVIAYSGLQTDDDYRFLRLWWEVDTQSERWLSFAKGGEYQPYADDLHLVVNWASEGREMKAFVESKYRQWSRHIKNTDKYFQPGLTYTERTTSDISIRAFPRNAIFSVSGPAVQCSDPETLLLAWSVLSSRPGRALMDTLVGSGDTSKSGTAARHYRTRLVAALPSVSSTTSLEQRSALKKNLRVLWNANQSVQVRDETHRLYAGFVVPQSSDGFESAALAELREDALDFVTASVAAAAIDRVVADAFGLSDETALAEFAGPHPSVPLFQPAAPPLKDVLARVLQLSDEELTMLALSSGLEGRVATKRAYFYSRQFELACLIAGRPSEDVVTVVDQIEPQCLQRRQRELAAHALSVAVGVAFGRWSAPWTSRDAVRQDVAKADPFEPLPPSSRAMGDLCSLDILVDDVGHDNDIVAMVNNAASGTACPSWLVHGIEDSFGASLRGILRSEFFSGHLSAYSKSRRKAPIYWQLATPSAAYSVWLYIHAFSKDTLFRVQSDFVAPKLAHEERRLDALTLELRDGATATERKALAEQQALAEELRAFLIEVKRVAPLWNPNLDDGVIINFAPLWRLVPQHKPWQKELQSTWDALCEGKYDWAHLAMHLWPERVVPKCAKDRSLAIAHGLESAFWEEDDNGRWQPRKVSQSQIDELIAERASAAVKDALRALLDAPAPVASRSGGRGPSRRGSTRRARSGASTGPAVPASPDPATLEAVRQVIAAGVDGVSKSDVLAATGLTDAQWNAAINALLADGSVTKIGAGRGTRYQRMTKT